MGGEGRSARKEGRDVPSNPTPLQIKAAEFSGRDYPVQNTVRINQEQSPLHRLDFFKKQIYISAWWFASALGVEEGWDGMG